MSDEPDTPEEIQAAAEFLGRIYDAERRAGKSHEAATLSAISACGPDDEAIAHALKQRLRAYN